MVKSNTMKNTLVLMIFILAATGTQAQFRKERSTWGQIGIGTAEVLGSEAISSLILYLSPQEFSQWEDKYWLYWGDNLKRAYTSPPVWDKDGWAVNYIGHPVQGSLAFNALRSQGAGFWESSAFTLGHTLLWEYLLEAINEQPSINDLIVTPIAGIALGELENILTRRLKRGGFTTAEKIIVTILNPFYLLNQGFKTKEMPEL
jgi:hypothetical protein